MGGIQILAQIVGAVGVMLLLASTMMRGRRKLLALDAAGSAVMGVHWALLGGTAAIAISALVVVMDLAGTDPRDPRGRMIIWASIPVTAVLLAVLWSGPADLFAALGMLGIAASRLSSGQIRLRALSMAACVPWIAYGAIMVSIPQIAFSVAYFIAMGVSILRIRSGRWRAATPTADPAILRADGS
jgi:hypothetical protein